MGLMKMGRQSSGAGWVRLVIGLCIAGAALEASADTISVPGDHPTIQAAINAAVNGDEVLVSPGIYTEAIDFSGKLIAVRSTAGSGSTTINANGTGQPAVRFDTFETAAAVLEGFRIINGTGVNIPVGFFDNADVGAGVYIDDASPTINDCLIEGNDTERGGGLFCADGAPQINNVTFSVNTATEIGGGVWLLNSDAAFDSCTFNGNEAAGAGASGGALGISGGEPTFTDCRFTNNDADATGGGAFVNNTNAHFTRCLFLANVAALDGGGMWIDGQNRPRLVSCSFLGNTAVAGGGVHVRFLAVGGRGLADAKFINCQFVGNTGLADGTTGSSGIGGGGLAIGLNGRVDLTNCTFQANRLLGTDGRGGGISVDSMALELRIVNSIFWDNSAPLAANIAEEQIRVHPTASGIVHVNFSCIADDNPNDASIPFGGAANDNIDDDPMFVDPNGADNIIGTEDDDASIGELSACRNVGDNTAPDLAGIVTDIAGNTRIGEDIVDMGCYEYRPLCGGDADGDLDVDLADLLLVISNWGSDGSGGGDLDNDGVVALSDLLAVISRWGAVCLP